MASLGAFMERSAVRNTRAPFRQIPHMGVIHVVAEAAKLGFRNGDPNWCNLGQGQPEVGEIEGAPARLNEIHFEPHDHAYGPVGGTEELRQTVADHYNRLYRQGKSSKYTAANVSIASGGRLVLSRIFAALGDTNVAYRVPDYSAYEDLIGYHSHRITPVLLPNSEEDSFSVSAETLKWYIANRGLGAFILSNPCNPTGCIVQGDALKNYVDIARESEMVLILDEFYSHFVYQPDGSPGRDPLSAAAFVEDVDSDPVLLVDGLTKSFRYPGWRVGWAVGPISIIDALDRVGSAIDGGTSQLVQRAAMQVLVPDRADRETNALRQVFSRKRNLMVRRLKEMGISCCPEPQGTFYCWSSVRNLPSALNSGEFFFREALKHKVLTVPGAFFDINPGKRRHQPSRFDSWVRFSFGPSEDNVQMGLDRLEKMIHVAK
jgi:aspartate/methionine/tyrosine aminotransferase